MKLYQVAVIVGSLRHDSFNRKLAEALVKIAPEQFVFHFLSIGDLPLYNQDDDAHQAESVLQLKNQIQAADAVLFLTPEYNRSIPGVLKNAIDHASRPYGQNSWSGKPAGVLGISVGSMGTALAQQHLHNILSHLNMFVLPAPEAFIQIKDNLFDATGHISGENEQFFQNWMGAFCAWVKKDWAH
jgi:chromate reductase, NAD(P)H dehydrogenase (quinone)